MSTAKKLLVVLGRLPLLFVVDSILKGTFLDFTEFPVDSLSPYQPVLVKENVSLGQNYHTVVLLLWIVFIFTVAILCLILVCSPIESLLEVYGCCLGFGLLVFSYHCNDRLVHGISYDAMILEKEAGVINSSESQQHNSPAHRPQLYLVMINMLTQFFIMLTFDQICLAGSFRKERLLTKFARYPLDVMLFFSFTLPIFLHSFLGEESVVYHLLPSLALIFPLLLLLVHYSCVIISLIGEVGHEIRVIRNDVREIGFDGFLMQLMEKANFSWLLRTFFLVKVIYQVLTSTVLSDAGDLCTVQWNELLNTLKPLVLDVLYSMCGTILSVMSMASIVSIVSGFCLTVVYRIIGAHEEEESFQPAISGFLFVLLAMQTGITSIANDSRLQLLFQNCILLVVANQHFVQTVAADLVLRASTDDSSIMKHVRPMLPYLIFFSFPFLVVMRLWEYPFRMSWLLAISAFSLELIIKSLGTLTFYALNMIHSHTNYLQENIEDYSFYIKAVCGCLEFICGIFLFFNGVYIFFFESGGVIRFVMMIIHFYCNIYQTALKGLKALRLRQSAWNKVNRLRLASQEQLEENNDICPICYQEMTEAVVVRCSHVFHRVCLQKWFSIQEKCPLCHVDLSDESSSATET